MPAGGWFRISAGLAAVHDALVGVDARAPERVAGPGAVGHPGEGVDVACRHEADPAGLGRRVVAEPVGQEVVEVGNAEVARVVGSVSCR